MIIKESLKHDYCGTINTWLL